jgi:hypothetical protein
MQGAQRLAMNVFGPADRTGADTPVTHGNDDWAQEQLAGIEVERDNEGHSWAFRKTRPDE